MLKYFPKKYDGNTNSCITTMILEHYLTQLDRKMCAKSRKILVFNDQCAADLKKTTFLRNIKVVFLPPNFTTQLQPLDLGIIRALKCSYRKQFN
jgi:hypothetical protein